MEILKDQLKKRNFIVPLVFLIIAVNPYTEIMEFKYQWLFMTTHYLLYIAGFVLSYKIMRGSILYLIPGIILPVFWHLPQFFALAGAYIIWRILNDSTLFIGGMFAGMTITKLSNAIKVLLLVLWMSGDSVLSVILIVGWPPYSNQVYPFSPFPVSQEIYTGIVMFGIMTAIFVYIVINMLRSIFKI
jgi:hypothetical protein